MRKNKIVKISAESEFQKGSVLHRAKLADLPGQSFRTDPRVVEAMIPYFTEIYGNWANLPSFWLGCNHRGGGPSAGTGGGSDWSGAQGDQLELVVFRES